MKTHTIKIENEKPTICTRCNEQRDSFPVAGNGHGKWYYRPICTRCKSRADKLRQNEWRRQSKLKDPEKWKLETRRRTLKRNYGITLEEYQQMLRKQGGCAICGKNEGLKEMPVDHCHKTGNIRGVLCHWCNKGLGQFFDNPSTLRKAADYIDRNNI
jgi:hypothetical protein